MPGKRIPDLTAIAGASTANDDNLVIYDTSEGTTKRILRSQLAAGIVGDLPYTPSGGISATTIPTAITELDSEAAKSAALAASSGSSLVGFLQSGTGSVNRTVQSKLREFVSVKDFGAVGDGVTDDTAAMQAAHNTGNVVYYPEGSYLFSRITGTTGGIVGAGYRTVLLSNDTTSGDVISFVRGGSAADTANRSAWVFCDFYLGASTGTEAQKTSGNAIKLSSSVYENFFTDIQNVSIRYFPNQLYLTNITFYRITNCNFFFYAGNAIYTDEPLSTDNGENNIEGCSFFNGLGHNTSSVAVYSYVGGMKFISNKINGGGHGFVQAALPSDGTSILLFSANTIENTTYSCLRFTVPSGTGTFGQITVIGNQFNPQLRAIYVESATLGQFENITIVGNVFLVGASGCYGIDLQSGRNILIDGNVFRGVSGNTITAAINIVAAAVNGIIGYNVFSGEIAGAQQIVNASTTVQANYLLNGVFRLNLATNTNIRFLSSAGSSSIESMNDARTAYQPLLFNGSIFPFNAPIRLPSYAVANLPSAASQGAGAVAFVTDANATTFAAIVAGGGANKIPVYSDGTNWRIG